MKKVKLLALSLMSILLIVGCSSQLSSNESIKEITILHAGSLTVPFKEVSQAFEKKYPNYKVLLEGAGSRDTVRKVTDLGRKVEIVASADYTVIEELMMPEYTDWYINFATNEMVLMYREGSKLSENINKDNWYEILLDSSVEYGHSEPDSDPCGYRSQLVWQLAEDYYGVEGLYKKLQNNRPAENIRPKETDLLALIDLGELDYIFIYKSVASQHGYPYLELPDEINLRTNEYSHLYKKSSYDVNGKAPGEKITKIGLPMVYGITIPNNAENPEGGELWIDFLLSEKGREIMNKNGQPSIIPIETNDKEALPKKIQDYL
jgi:molybdate/tungstate transport system substrate-binding protein